MPSVDVSGTRLHYVRAGAGEPILLIQGMAATHLTWGERFYSALAESFDCIAFDNRGMGRSGRANLPFTVADLAADAAGVLEALGIERAHVLGISLGGMAAQELALAHPERVQSVVLGATYCGGPRGRLPGREIVERLGAAMASGNRERVYHTMWELMLSPTFRADETRFDAFRDVASALPAPRAVIVEQLRAGAQHDASDRLGGISAPALVVHGTADGIFTAGNGEQIASLIPARLELLEGVGHLFWWEQPERSAQLIREHALAPA
jgi:pimeloyl-ACP methyl ester carboxylesterase